MIISMAPVRLSLFGGGTDYSGYYKRKGGVVLGTTINKYTYVSVNRLSDFFEYSIRVGYSKAELVNNVNDIAHPSVRETLKYMNIAGNMDIHIFADLPARTGLGSSSSFTVAFLNALNALNGRQVSKQKLAEEVIHIEQNLIKESVGCQDQMHCAYGGLNIISFEKSGIAVRAVDISAEKKDYLSSSMLVFFTGLTRYADEIAKDKVKNIETKSNDSFLDRMKEMVCEAEEIILNEPKKKMVERLGTLLDEGWELKKKLSDKVTNSEIDEYYSKGLEAGAWGGKIAGAGGGGFLFFLVPDGKKADVRKALGHLLEVDFEFESDGAKIIFQTG